MNDLVGHIEMVQEFEGSCPVAYMIKGHVDKQDFLEAVRDDYGKDFSLDDVKQSYYRNVPYGEYMIMINCEKGRGAYPVTHIDI